MPAFDFQERFAPLVESGRKPSTIRKTMRCKIGDTVQLYTGQRTKQCRKLGEGICIGLAQITIGLEDGTPWAVQGRIGDVFLHKRLHEQEGFMNVNEMAEFFRQRYGLPFKGYLHVWELKGKPMTKHDYQEAQRQPEDLVERVAVDVRDHTDMHCGLTLGGVTMFCDDARLSCEKDGHGNPLRQTRCQCKDIAKAALTAITYDRKQVRREALEEAATLIKEKRLHHAHTLGGDREDYGFRASENAIRALIEKEG